jgi:hypothetical protein
MPVLPTGVVAMTTTSASVPALRVASWAMANVMLEMQSEIHARVLVFRVFIVSSNYLVLLTAVTAVEVRWGKSALAIHAFVL